MDFAAIQQCKPEMINKFPSQTSWHDGSTVPQQKGQMKRVPNLRHPALSYKVIKKGIKHKCLTSRTTLSLERQRSSESFHWVPVIPRNQESRRYDTFIFYDCLGEIRLWPDPRDISPIRHLSKLLGSTKCANLWPRTRLGTDFFGCLSQSLSSAVKDILSELLVRFCIGPWLSKCCLEPDWNKYDQDTTTEAIRWSSNCLTIPSWPWECAVVAAAEASPSHYL